MNQLGNFLFQLAELLIRFVGYFMISILFILLVSEKRRMQRIFIGRLVKQQELAEVTKFVFKSQLEEDRHCDEIELLELMELETEIEFERHSNQ